MDETLSIIVAVIGTGIALWRVNKASMDRLHVDISNVRNEISDVRGEISDVRSEISDVRSEIGGLRERMARLEGLFEGFTGKARQKDA